MTIAKTCTPDVLSAEEARQANAIVVGLTSDGPVVPIGFRCDGIVGEVDAKGQLRAYSACSEITTAILRDQGDAPSVNRSSTATVIASKGSPGPSSGTHSAAATGQGLSVGPLHHRTPRRAPNPAAPPNPRLQEPVSNSRP